jgi:hypothetical protein
MRLWKPLSRPFAILLCWKGANRMSPHLNPHQRAPKAEDSISPSQGPSDKLLIRSGPVSRTPLGSFCVFIGLHAVTMLSTL